MMDAKSCILLIFGCVFINTDAKKLPCGNPPVCNFYTSIGLLECLNVEEFPELQVSLCRKTEIIIITGPEFRKWPSSLKNKDLFPMLKTVVMKKTGVSCRSIPFSNVWYEIDYKYCKDEVSKQPNISMASPRPIPKHKLFTDGPNNGTNSSTTIIPHGLRPANNLTTVTTHLYSLYNETASSSYWNIETTGSPNSSRELFEASIGLFIFSAVGISLVILFIVMRYRRQHRGAGCARILKIGHRLPPVETLGAMGSDESIELFSRQSSSVSSDARSVRRRSVDREM